MIWIWIFSAWILSIVALGKEKVRFEHLFWMLLPIDMYGVTVAGFTIKPYMFFCAFLLLQLLNRKPSILAVRSRWSLTSGFYLLLMLAVNLINTASISSAMAAAMALVVWGCCMVYLNECRPDSGEDICRVLVSTAIGYGLVFTIAYMTVLSGNEFPGVYTDQRMEPGIFLNTGNVYMGQYIEVIRFRGFTIDPNNVLATFLLGTLAALLRLSSGKGGKCEIFAIILSAACILMTNSRMGLLCFIAILVMGMAVSYRLSNKRRRNILKCVILALVFFLLIILVTTDLFFNVVQWIISLYANRSALNDEFGRFTIWREALHVFWEHNILIGIGLGQMQYYTSTSRACHNTWLEFICSSGIILGGIIVIHFAAMIGNGLRSAIIHNGEKNNAFIWTMVLGTLGILLALVSVDNVTYSYLWAGAMTVAAISRGYWKES